MNDDRSNWDSLIPCTPLTSCYLCMGLGKSWWLSVNSRRMVFEGRQLTWHIVLGVMLALFAYWLETRLGISDSNWFLLLTIFPLAYSVSLTFGLALFNAAHPRVEFARIEGLLKLPTEVIPLSRVRAIQILEYLRPWESTRKFTISLDSKGKLTSVRNCPVFQINLVYWDGQKLTRMLLTQSTRDRSLIADAKAMANYLEVPLCESYLPWKTLGPFYNCHGPVMRICLGILVLACLFVWFVASLDSPHSKEFLQIGSGLISISVLMLSWGGWSGYHARRRAVSRSVLKSSLLD